MIDEESVSEPKILNKLIEYSDSDYYPYHMPGHKRNSGMSPLSGLLKIDVTEIEGFDNLHDAEGIIKDAQDKIAMACGVKKSYMLVNGSTCGVLASISALVPQNGELLIVRNAHKSAYNAMILRNISPVYIYPDVDESVGICEAVSPRQVGNSLKSAIEARHNISAVFVVSPTYEGKIANIREIANIVHSYNIPLIVDEAHGAHLPFARNIDGYGESACLAGADIVIQSAHKTLPAPTQTAVLHINGSLVDSTLVEKFLHIYETSSPSYPLMAGLEAAYDVMINDGAEFLFVMKERFYDLIESLKRNCRVLKVANSQDIGKLVIYTTKKNITGKYIADILRKKHHLETELSGERYVLAMFTVGDTKEGYERMEKALIEIDGELSSDIELIQEDVDEIYNPCTHNESVMSLSDAYGSKYEQICLEEASGRASSDFVMLYPPGIPILAPGEEITDLHIKTIKEYLLKNLQVIGIEDEKITVI